MSRLFRQVGTVPKTRLLCALWRLADRLWIWITGSHLLDPTTIGTGNHDCAPASLYWVAPWLPEDRIVEAFQVCADNWPFAGVTNKEFAIALAYLRVEVRYFPDTETLGALVERKPSRCVALLHGHFIAIVDGKIVGRDARLASRPNTKVYCYWIISI